MEPVLGALGLAHPLLLQPVSLPAALMQTGCEGSDEEGLQGRVESINQRPVSSLRVIVLPPAPTSPFSLTPGSAGALSPFPRPRTSAVSAWGELLGGKRLFFKTKNFCSVPQQ